MTERFRENGKPGSGPKATPPASLTPLPEHPAMPSPSPAETSRRIGDIKKDIYATLPQGIVDKLPPELPSPSDEGVFDVGEDSRIARPKTKQRGGIDPDGINPNTAFGSDEDVLWGAIEQSDRLPIIPDTSASGPSPKPTPTPKQKPTGRPKRRPITNRLNQDKASLLERAGSAIGRVLKKINPFS